jgi:outer membrane protein assembly factor BamB
MVGRLATRAVERPREAECASGSTKRCAGRFIAWSTNRGGPYIPTPLIYRDQLYIVQVNGVLAASDVRTGQRLYQQRLGSGGSFSASPVGADGKIYFASEDGDIFVVKAGPTYQLLATNVMGEVVMATPAISSGMIIIRGLKNIFAIGQPTATKPSRR